MKIDKFIVGFVETNCYLLESQGEMAVIDPGGETDKIINIIKEKKIRLKYIIVTHFHFDHTLGVSRIKDNFKEAQIVTHEKELPFLEHFFDMNGIVLGAPSEKDYVNDKNTYVNFKPDLIVKEGDEIEVGDEVMKIFHTPGHTPGSMCLFGSNFVFSGDTLFKDGYGRTDLMGGSVSEIKNSLARLDEIIKPNTIVYPGHGEIFTK